MLRSKIDRWREHALEHDATKPMYEVAANTILAVPKKVPPTTQFPIGTF